MSDLVIPLTVVGALLGALTVVLLLIIARRYWLTRVAGSFDCSMRREAGRSASGWTLGIARYEQDRLDWFKVFAPGLRPTRSFARSRLLIEDRRAPIGVEGYTVSPGTVIVECRYGALTLELAMSEAAANGLASWLEGAPPGQPSLLA